MAPFKRKLDDDLVFTLSDRDSAPEKSPEAEDSSRPPNNIWLNASKKKVKADDDNNTAQPKKKHTKFLRNLREGSSGEGSVSESDCIEQDGSFNPDFEFDVGILQSTLVQDFDGWDLSEPRTALMDREFGNKKGVDIDGIIQRRQVNRSKFQKSTPLFEDTAIGDTSKNGGERELDDDGQGSPSLNEDDELLAEDGFGMGATFANEETDGENADSDISNLSISTDNGNDVSDGNRSTSSPTAHPDDLGRDSESDIGSDEAEEKRKQRAFFAPEEPSITTDLDQNISGQSFHNFSLSRPILRGIGAVGFSTPTPIQSKTIPVALFGKDVVGGAVTGSGKTAAFIIPILERLLYRPRKVPTSRVAILMPTRELAVQCFNVATKLASFTDITFCQLVGGFSLREQENILKKRPDVVIATPGRFIDHMRNSASFTVDSLEILVLDEADRMLEDGFADELNEILNTIPKSRQTMLFSATMTDSVDKLIRLGLNRPVRLVINPRKQTVGTLVQEFVRLRPGKETKRLAYLLLLCTTVYTDRVIVFFRQKKEAHRVRVIFGLSGLKATELHGSMSQEQRISNVEDFRSGKASFLLATDVASRGLDIKGVETVLNYEAPQTHEIYLHRVGRTARAGRAGRACTIAAEPDRKIVKAAVKSGRSQEAKIVSRTVDTSEVDKWAQKINDLEDEVKGVLAEEKEEKQLAQAEMQVTRGDNLIKHHNEIVSRPRRTWFESAKDKMTARKASLMELNGPSVKGKKTKPKLSGKDKKRLDSHKDRVEGKEWKKKANTEAMFRHSHTKTGKPKSGRK